MGDYRIRMQFEIDAAETAVREALTTREGIASWWSDTIDGEPDREGGDLFVTFPGVPERFHFQVSPGSPIVWRTQEFPPWWAGTTIRWRVERSPEDQVTLLHFEHGGFEPDADIIPIVTPAWADIVRRLVSYAETGEADPFAR